MAKETKTAQCYPDDAKINKMTDEYGAFGWELISNQRCREEGAYVVTTFNKLTFSRDKSAPWYSEIVELENRYRSLMDREPVDHSVEPSKGWLFYGIVGVVLGAAIWALMGSIMAGIAGGIIGIFDISVIIPALVVIGIGSILLIIYTVKNKRYKKEYSAYYTRKREWESTSKKEAEQIRQKAEAIVNAE